MAGPVLSRSRLALRAVIIGLLCAQQVGRWLVGWLWLLLIFAGYEKRKAWFGQVVLALFRALGATFIKVGQIMSTRPDLLPPHVIHALERLQDDVGPFPWAEVQAIVAEELGRPLDQVFEEFSPAPIASASVAQVHRARLPGGRVVAVK